MADLVGLAVHLTQTLLQPRLMWSSALEASVLEVKVMEGMGTTLDVVLVNGELHEGDTIVVCGLAGPITSSIGEQLREQLCGQLRAVSWVGLEEGSTGVSLRVECLVCGPMRVVTRVYALRSVQTFSL